MRVGEGFLRASVLGGEMNSAGGAEAADVAVPCSRAWREHSIAVAG